MDKRVGIRRDRAYRAGRAAREEHASAIKPAQKKELPKALEFGSAEAWKKITSAMVGGKKDKYAKATAKATERTADATEEIADREVEEVGIAP